MPEVGVDERGDDGHCEADDADNHVASLQGVAPGGSERGGYSSNQPAQRIARSVRTFFQSSNQNTTTSESAPTR